MNNHLLQKLVLQLRGLHCRSCEILLEEKFSEVKHVVKSEVDYRRGTAVIYYETEKPLAKELEKVVLEAGYTLGEKVELTFFSQELKDYKELLKAGIIVFVAYWGLKWTGVLGLINFSAGSSQFNWGTSLLVGLVAGVSSCLALVGGLVLGLSAKHAESHPEATAKQKFRPHIYFNVGRVVGYFFFGGLLGILGSVFQLSTTVTMVLTILAGVVMLVVGLQLLEISPRLNAWKLTLPKGLASWLGIKKHQAEYNHKNALTLGALTFFLPCGFTQAMQVFAVSSGSFVGGAMIMGLFALGTVPGLLSIGGLTSTLKGQTAKKFFRLAGVVVVLFALFSFSNGLALAGIKFDFKSEVNKTVTVDPNVTLVNGVQVVRMTETSGGYSPNKFTIQRGVPVQWVITAKAPYSCASSLVVPQLGIRKDLTPGENIIQFTPTTVGKLAFSCSMGMYTGSFNVVEAGGQPLSAGGNGLTVASGGSCGTSGGCGCGGGGNRPAVAVNPTPTEPITGTISQEEVQVLKAVYTDAKFLEPADFKVKAGIKTRLEIEVRDNGVGCGYALTVPELTTESRALRAGVPITLEFLPETPGYYEITCGMGMIRFGSITVQ